MMGMKTKYLFVLTAAVALLAMVGTVSATGWTGYHKNNIFVGTGYQWCDQKLGWTAAQCDSFLGTSAPDKITMKWNEKWDLCNAAGNNDPSACTGAWTDNEWNGNVPGGDGMIWHYKIVWSQTCANGETLTDGGYCIWGSYEVLMDQGTFDGLHSFFAHATPNGYGS